jgi:hypothetical protein
MGWWKLEDGTLVGDGPLDAVEHFLRTISQEYQSDQGRKPDLNELIKLLSLVLRERSDEFTRDCDELEVIGFSVKTKARPKKRTLRIGDVFAIPLGDGKYAFGILTPQSGFAEFFKLVSVTMPSIRELKNTSRFRLPVMFSTEALERRQWKILGNIPFDIPMFRMHQFRIGGRITNGVTVVKDGFIDCSSSLRLATVEELESVPEFCISGNEVLIDRLRRELKLGG